MLTLDANGRTVCDHPNLEAIVQLCDLGQGYHLVPVRDHCRSLTLPTPTDRDWDIAWEELHDGNWTYAGNCYRAGVIAERRALARVRKRRPSRRMLTHRRMMGEWFDPMAIQAKIILRGVLDDLRNG